MTTKVLLFKLGAMGDVIATSAVAKSLVDSGYQVNFVTLKSYANTLSYLPKESVHIIPDNSKATILLAMLLLPLKLISKRFDYVICFHRRSIIFQLFCLFSRSKIRVGYTPKGINLYHKHTEFKIDVNRTIQEFNLLDLTGLPYRKARRLFQEADADLDLKLPEKYITICPGGGNQFNSIGNRQWSLDNYQNLIDSLSKNFPVIILGAGKEDEKLIPLFQSKHNVHNFIGKLSLSSTAEVIKRSLLFIGNDSGLLYVSAGVGTKTLGLFGPTNHEAALPYGNNCFELSMPVNCSPCYDPREGQDGKMYTCSNNICMKAITVKNVEDEIYKIISYNF